MPLPEWAVLGAVTYYRPHDQNVRILRASGAIIVSVLQEEVLLINLNQVVFSADSETLERNWIPLSEAEPLFSNVTPGMVYTAGAPEFVGVLPVRTDLVIQSQPNPDWIVTGTRLQPISGDGPCALVIAVLGSSIQIRDLGGWPGNLLTLGTIVRSYPVEQIIELYRPLPPPMPSWFAIGSRIIQDHNNRTYIVLSFDPIRWSMVVTLEDEMYPTSFSVNDFILNWRPASSITEQRPNTSITNITRSIIQVAPEWLQVGGFLRSLWNPKYKVFVSSLDPSLFIVRLTKVSSLKPLVLNSVFEEIEYNEIGRQFTPIDEFGSPKSEYTCPKCKEIGVRDPDAEKRRASIDTVRAYTCKKEHTWYFISGTEQDGKPANPSRFERDIGI